MNFKSNIARSLLAERRGVASPDFCDKLPSEWGAGNDRSCICFGSQIHGRTRLSACSMAGNQEKDTPANVCIVAAGWQRTSDDLAAIVQIVWFCQQKATIGWDCGVQIKDLPILPSHGSTDTKVTRKRLPDNQPTRIDRIRDAEAISIQSS